MNDGKPPPSLKELDSKLKNVQKERRQTDGAGMPPTRFGQSVHLGLEMAATLAVGGGVGWYLDQWLGTKPWLLVAFVFLGIGAGLSNAFRLARRYSAELARQEDHAGAKRPPEDGE
jgi:ATP synthase protein I